MYIEDLITTFKNITKDNYPELNTEEFLNELKLILEKKKYDLQDQTIIERILSEDAESFSESFLEILETTVADSGDKHSFFNNDNGGNTVIDLYIKSIEQSIDYFYNDIISKQFSGK
jgi:hypothetical protein